MATATTTFTTGIEEPLTTATFIRALSSSASEFPPDISQIQESGIKYITSRAEHDKATSHAEKTVTPTVLYVSYSPSPPCKTFTPQYEKLAHSYSRSKSAKEREIVWCQMEYEKETSPMMKFGPQHCPILVLIKGSKCRTILGGDIKALERAVESEFLQE